MTEWYYAVGDERQGPVDTAEIERLIEVGTVTPDTLVWKAELANWEPARSHFTFTGATPPPLQQAAPEADTNPEIGPDGLYVGAPSREFMEAAKVCMSKYATFSGRASRSEFWFFYLFTYIVVFVAQIVDVVLIMAIAASGVPFFVPIFSVIAIFGLLLPQLAVSWRRIHDLDRTGWWLGGGMLVSLVFYIAIIVVAIAGEASGQFSSEPPPAFFALIGFFVLGMLIYGIVIFIFYVTKGTLGPNRFG
ncbi:DUF805 domain-containing protein [Gymnodinialimonas hymeniacidonis]|uniref:DUF805 domain-containing protein n=1 Tax=Gymnodinialimonas hymeniacidonis TaxID=3126508 RepID=UPI0034C6BD88